MLLRRSGGPGDWSFHLPQDLVRPFGLIPGQRTSGQEVGRFSRLDSCIALGSQTLSYAFDGPLVTGQTWSGVISGSVAFAYNSDFEIASIAVNGDAVTYEFDLDRLVTSAGALEITRDVATGFITDTSLDQVRTTQTFNAFGELASYTGESIQPGGIEALVDEINALLDDLEGTYIIEELGRADIDDFRAYVADVAAAGAAESALGGGATRGAIIGGAVGSGFGGAYGHIGGAVGGLVGGGFDGGKGLGRRAAMGLKGGYAGLIGGTVQIGAEYLLERAIAECEEECTR